MAYKSDSDVRFIVLHYSATPIERDISAADIDRMHKARGWKGIGYHYYIRKDGTVENGRDMSKPGKFEVGSHVRGSNSISIGICCEGGVTLTDKNTGVDNRTEAQKEALIGLIDNLKQRYPIAIVGGHRDMPGAATQCPGYNAAVWWAEVQANRPNEAKKKRRSWWSRFKGLWT